MPRLGIVRRLSATREPDPVDVGVCTASARGAQILGRDDYDVPVCHSADRDMRTRGRDRLKSLARAASLVAVSPALCSYLIRRLVMGADRALMGSSQALSLIPGVPGQYLRTAFLRCVLARCAASVTIEFGTIFSQAGARLDENVYVGPMCHLGLVHLERDVLIAAGVHIPSGPETHGIADIDRPIREQPGNPRMVRIGTGAWIGSASVVMADVGERTVVAAGAVVTREVPRLVIAGGVPAQVLRPRT